jgi:hypothetical protein
MMSHTILYIDEMRKGNYKIFLEHVFSQLPTPFRWSQVDEEILKQHSQELLEIANDLAETYCTVMSNTNIEFFRTRNVQSLLRIGGPITFRVLIMICTGKTRDNGP